MGRLVGAPQPARDQQEGRLLRWRARLDRVSVEQEYYEWFARVARRGRFLSRAADLADPRWTLGPAGIPIAAAHPRDDLAMPGDAPAPRRRQPQVPRPRQAAPVRGKLSRRDQ
ncbi:hypothetical protein PIB30_114128, partial [Stylosanthes scabra]|nr:hypothetical protein [Stylosanthes scabra]